MMRKLLTVGGALLVLALLVLLFVAAWLIAGTDGIRVLLGIVLFLVAAGVTIACWTLYFKRRNFLAVLLLPLLLWVLLYLAYEYIVDDRSDTPGSIWLTNAWEFPFWHFWGWILLIVAFVALLLSFRRGSGGVVSAFFVIPMVVMTVVSWLSWDGWYSVFNITPAVEQSSFQEFTPDVSCEKGEGLAISCSADAIEHAVGYHWFVMRESEVDSCDPRADEDNRPCDPSNNNRMESLRDLDPEFTLNAPDRYVVFMWAENKQDDYSLLYKSEVFDLTAPPAAPAAAALAPGECPGGHKVLQPERGGDGSLNAAGVIQRGPGTEAPTKEQVLAQAKVDPLTLLNWYVATPLHTNSSFAGYAPLRDVSDAGQFVEGGDVVDGACYNQAGIDAYNRFAPVVRDLAHFSYRDVVTYQGANTGVNGDNVTQENGVHQTDESGYDVDYVNADGTPAGPSHSALSICSQVTTGNPTPGIPEGETTNEEVTIVTEDIPEEEEPPVTTTGGKVAPPRYSDAPDPADRGNGPAPAPVPSPGPVPSASPAPASPSPDSQVVEGPPPVEVSDPQGDAPVLSTPAAPPTDGPENCDLNGNCS